jgi:hypothetical protein
MGLRSVLALGFLLGMRHALDALTAIVGLATLALGCTLIYEFVDGAGPARG